MIAADHDRGDQLTFGHHFVERQPYTGSIAETNPADARRKALKLDAALRHVEPVVQMGVAGQEFLYLGIGFEDVLCIARQRHPAERTDAATEQGPDISGYEAGDVESIFHAALESHLTNI